MSLEPAARPRWRVDLMRDLDAVASLGDHLLQIAHLPFDPTEARNLAPMVDGHAGVVVLGARHRACSRPKEERAMRRLERYPS